MNAQAEPQQVAARDGRFQLQRSAQGDDAAMIDKREAFAERVGFFHVVGGQQNRCAALVVFADDLPQKQTRLRVQTSAGFIQKKHLRVVHHGARDGEALHHAAGEAADHLIGAIGELEAFEERFGALGAFLRGKAEIGAMENQNLARGQREIKIGALGYYSDEALDGDLRLPDIVFAYERLATGGADARRKNAHGGGFAGAVRAKETENFSGQDVEGDAVERDNLWLWLLALGLWRAKGKATGAGGHRRSRGVDLAQVDGTNARYHGDMAFRITQNKPLR